MRVLRIELEAPVCSFRYPHFLVGRQLTFEMPPPSTIFGHVASALGEWPDPSSFRFAYHFVASGKGDVESQHIVYPGSGKFMAGGEKHPAALHATIQPVPRQFLLGVRLVLYLDRVDLIEAFRNRRFPVILGRSQDLACYSRVEVVGLERADRGYFEATILPAEFRKRTERGMTVLMSRYIGLAVWISSDFPVRARTSVCQRWNRTCACPPILWRIFAGTRLCGSARRSQPTGGWSAG